MNHKKKKKKEKEKKRDEGLGERAEINMGFLASIFMFMVFVIKSLKKSSRL